MKRLGAFSLIIGLFSIFSGVSGLKALNGTVYPEGLIYIIWIMMGLSLCMCCFVLFKRLFKLALFLSGFSLAAVLTNIMVIVLAYSGIDPFRALISIVISVVCICVALIARHTLSEPD